MYEHSNMCKGKSIEDKSKVFWIVFGYARAFRYEMPVIKGNRENSPAFCLSGFFRVESETDNFNLRYRFRRIPA
jgi:hypothetical protein